MSLKNVHVSKSNLKHVKNVNLKNFKSPYFFVCLLSLLFLLFIPIHYILNVINGLTMPRNDQLPWKLCPIHFKNLINSSL